jgi:hypothetical protein
VGTRKPDGYGFGQNFKPVMDTGFLMGVNIFHGYEFGIAKPGGFVPVAISRRKSSEEEGPRRRTERREYGKFHYGGARRRGRKNPSRLRYIKGHRPPFANMAHQKRCAHSVDKARLYENEILAHIDEARPARSRCTGVAGLESILRLPNTGPWLGQDRPRPKSTC